MRTTQYFPTIHQWRGGRQDQGSCVCFETGNSPRRSLPISSCLRVADSALAVLYICELQGSAILVHRTTLIAQLHRGVSGCGPWEASTGRLHQLAQVLLILAGSTVVRLYSPHRDRLLPEKTSSLQQVQAQDDPVSLSPPNKHLFSRATPSPAYSLVRLVPSAV